MILSNVELHRALDAGRLVIRPEPHPRIPTVAGGHCPYDTHSVDLTLGDEISIPQVNAPYAYDLTQPGSLARFIAQNSERRLSADSPYPLKKGTFLLGRTHEYVGLPIREGEATCLDARIEGKSSRAVSRVWHSQTTSTLQPSRRTFRRPRRVPCALLPPELRIRPRLNPLPPTISPTPILLLGEESPQIARGGPDEAQLPLSSCPRHSDQGRHSRPFKQPSIAVASAQGKPDPAILGFCGAHVRKARTMTGESSRFPLNVAE